MTIKNVPSFLTLATLILGGAFVTSRLPVQAVEPAVAIVTPGNLGTTIPDAYVHNNWFIYNDEAPEGIDNTLATFVMGPADPLGEGSVQISVTGTQRRNLATYRFKGTPLAEITHLRYSTYNPSAGNGGSANRSGYLNFNVDFNGSDSWQRRLVYVPADNGTVQQNTWQEWDTINGGNALWKYSGPTWPGTSTPGTTTKTWSQILAEYPGVRMRVSDSFLGIRVGEPYANGYTENLDAFVFGTTTGGVTTFDFEPSLSPANKDDCKGSGWMKFNDPLFKNQGSCVSWTNANR